MAMFTSESASSLLKAEETSSASSLPRNFRPIRGMVTPRWKRYEKVTFHASYHILPYLTISYHILPYLTISYHILPYLTTFFCIFSRIWTFLLGVAIPRNQIKSNQTKSNQTNVMSHANWFDDFESTEFMYLMILVVSKLATSSCQLESKCCWVWGYLFLWQCPEYGIFVQSQGWPLGRLTYLRTKQPESTL